MFFFSVLLVLVGIAVITIGANESAERLLRLSEYLGISEFVTSFVVVGIAAILPEFFIGIVSAFSSASTFGLGVVWGSNVADLTLIVGVIVLIKGHLRVAESTLRYARRFLMIVGLPVLFFFIHGEISRFDGFLLILAFIIYVAAMLWTKPVRLRPGKRKEGMRFLVDVPILSGALALLLVGAIAVTNGSSDISVLIGLPLFVVGVIVAAGTDLPELIFGIEGARGMYGDLVFGPILGCVLADAMLTTGLIAFINPIKTTQPSHVLSSGLLMVISAVLVTFLFRKRCLNRKDGFILVVFYLVFLLIQFLVETLVI
jgi:cation:H+ antiporter